MESEKIGSQDIHFLLMSKFIKIIFFDGMFSTYKINILLASRNFDLASLIWSPLFFIIFFTFFTAISNNEIKPIVFRISFSYFWSGLDPLLTVS